MIKIITFSITDSEDLKKLKSFKEVHMSTCRDKYPDVLGALLKYTFIPTGLGNYCIVKCSCGEQISLDKDMA